MVPTFGSQPSVDHLTSVQALRGCTKAQLREVNRADRTRQSRRGERSYSERARTPKSSSSFSLALERLFRTAKW